MYTNYCRGINGTLYSVVLLVGNHEVFFHNRIKDRVK